MCHQALSLCSSLANQQERHEASFFEAVRVLLNRLETNGGKKKYSLTEVNEKVNELLKQSVISEGVIIYLKAKSTSHCLILTS